MSETNSSKDCFQFKQFSIRQVNAPMKVGTDGVLLGAWARVESTQKILDIGTGTGVIALMVAQRSPGSQIFGIDIDASSIIDAQFNVDHSIWKDNIHIEHVSLQDFDQLQYGTFDLIVSNPPFFTGGVFSFNQDKAAVRHTIKLSHADLLGYSRKLLKADGRLALILPYLEGERLVELAKNFGFAPSLITEVRGRANKPIERMLIELSVSGTFECKRDQIIIEKDARNDWTDDYRKLMKDFLLKA
jgi:tRNA1Val (adenine37-N6)-methyltransferase